MSDTIGFLGLILNLYSMYSKGEYKMRVFSMLANCIYLIYGVLISGAPIIIGSIIAVLVHLFRIKNLKIKAYEKL